ncbi:MAG: ATPase F0F1 [Planctomycetota bacterium]|nr:MAG: ATPase F0F1 [Planctomycetota bacterium]
MDETENRPGGSERKEFGDEVKRKESRKLKARREKNRQVWFGLGMFGLVGWSVTIPTLVLTAIGAWVDSKSEGRISWTLTLLMVGVALGCINAWFWIKRETENKG